MLVTGFCNPCSLEFNVPPNIVFLKR
jgi:hypothetical protein